MTASPNDRYVVLKLIIDAGSIDLDTPNNAPTYRFQDRPYKYIIIVIPCEVFLLLYSLS